MTARIPLVLTFTVLLVALATPARGEEAPLDALTKAAESGKISAELVERFRDYSLSRARASAVDAALPDDFWEWLPAHPELRSALALALHPEYRPKVLANLAGLRAASPSAAGSHPHLMLAFALAWSAGGGDEPRRFHHDENGEKRRPSPGMVDSFRWYLDHESELRFPLRSSPWPVLAFLADCRVPLEERRWTLERYGEESMEALSGLHKRVPRREGVRVAAPGLATWLKYGGGPALAARFHVEVLQSLGIPALTAGSGKSRWSCWVAARPDGAFEFRRSSAAAGHGAVRDPIGRVEIDEGDVSLRMAALGRAYARFEEAFAAVHAYDVLASEKGIAATELLEEAVRRNPRVQEAWIALADAAAGSRLSPKRARVVLSLMLRKLADHPCVAVEVLDRALHETGDGGASVDGARQLLARAAALVAGSPHPELAPKVELLRGRCFEMSGKEEEALRHYEAMAREYAFADESVRDQAIDRALRVLGADRDRRDRFFEGLLEAVRYRTPELRKKNALSGVYFLLATRWVEDVRGTGGVLAADRLRLRLLRERQDRRIELDAGSRLKITPALGGTEGGPFLDVNEKGRRLQGVRLTAGSYGGCHVVRSLEPLYDAQDGPRPGVIYGHAKGEIIELVARDGYAVGGLIVKKGALVDGLAVVFMRKKDRGLDDKDLYISRWVGGRRGCPETLLGATGESIIGVHGRSTGALSAIGLVFRPD